MMRATALSMGPPGHGKGNMVVAKVMLWMRKAKSSFDVGI